MKRPAALVIGPHRAEGGAGLQLNLLFGSRLAEEFSLLRFGAGGHDSGGAGIVAAVRAAIKALALGGAVLVRGAAIVHVNSALSSRSLVEDLACVAAAKACGARVVCQMHGGTLPAQVLRGRRLRRSFLRSALALADAVVVSTQMELRAYRKYLGVTHVAAIPPCLGRLPAAGRARRAAGSPLRLVYVGELAREKGLYETLHGLRLARDCGVAANLVVAGSGPDECGLRNLARELGLAGQVAFGGPVSGARAARLLAESDVMVLASHSEGMPYALLEAMASGAAVIATRVGGVPDVIVDGVHGLFVPPYNPLAIARAIQRLAGDRTLLERMTEACRRRVAGSFSSERLADDFVRLYWELCGGRPMKALHRS
jgi:glycosyltransferase involved in cell wall biosynthesis